MGAVLLRQRRPLEAKGCAGDPAPLPRECQATEPWRLRGGGPPTRKQEGRAFRSEVEEPGKGPPHARSRKQTRFGKFCIKQLEGFFQLPNVTFSAGNQ